MIVDYENTMEDMVAFNAFHSRNSPAVKRLLWIYRIVLAAVGCWSSYDIITKDANAEAQRVIVTVLVVAALIGLIMLLASGARRLATNWLVRRMYNEGDGSNPLLGKRRLELSESGIVESGGGAEVRVGWQAIDRALETERYFFIYLGAMAAIVIPKYKLDSAVASRISSELTSAGVTVSAG